MPIHKKDEKNVLDIESSEDASFVPVEGDADSDGEKSDAQLVDDGAIVLESGEDDLLIAKDSKSDVSEATEQAESETGDEPPAGETDGEVEDTDKKPDESEAKPKEDKQPKKAAAPDKVQIRINKITAEKYEEKRRADRLATENAALKKKLKDSTDAKDLATLEGQKPKAEDFDTEAEFYEKLGRWGAKMELREQKVTEAPANTTDVEEKASDDPVKDLLDLGVETYPDFNEVVKNPDVLITETMVQALQDSEHAVGILYHLGNNVEETNRIAALKTPASIAREIGRIETLFDDGMVSEVATHDADQDTEDKTTKKNLSNAPQPVKPIGGGGKVTKQLEDMSIKEYRDSRGYTRGGDRKVLDPRVA